jgi:hypothetical protein
MNKIAMVSLSILTIATPKTVSAREFISPAAAAPATSFYQTSVSPTELMEVQLHAPALATIVVRIPSKPVIQPEVTVPVAVPVKQAMATVAKVQPPVAHAGDMREYAEKLVAATFGPEQFAAFDRIIFLESSWNPNAVNQASGACGLAQALPCSKYTDNSPQGQIKWAVEYIKERYVTPARALGFHNVHGWY